MCFVEVEIVGPWPNGEGCKAHARATEKELGGHSERNANSEDLKAARKGVRK